MTHLRAALLMSLALAALLAACSSPPTPSYTQTQRGSSASSDPTPAGHSDIGPCEADSECRIADNCGCACDALLLTVRRDQPACEETCRGDGCAGKVAHCNPSTHQCEAAPVPEQTHEFVPAPS